MLFRSFVYLDTEALNHHLSELQGNQPSVRKQKKSKTVEGKVNAGIASFSGTYSNDIETEDTSNINSKYELFEKELEKHKDSGYYDTLTGSYDLSTIAPMSIFRINGSFSTPESFDMFSMVKQFAPMMNKAGLLDSGQDKNTAEMALSFFEDANPRLPILIDLDDLTVISKLKTEYLKIDYADFEDLELEESVILGRSIAVDRSEEVEIFDPLKEFIKLNRSARRNAKRNESTEAFKIAGPVLKSEIIAIYH